MQEAMAFQKIKKSWESFLSDNFSSGWLGKVQPIKLKGGVLHVRCADSVWANEMRLKQGLLVDRARKCFKTIKIEQLRIYN